VETTSKWHKFPGLPKWSPEIVPTGLLELWTAITPDYRVGSRRGLNQSCIPRRDLSNAMSHTQIGRREKVDSWLLVVGSQTGNLTPDLSFAHNLGCRCPNYQCEGIFDIYVSRRFQWHQEHPNARCFGFCCRALNIRESRRTPDPNFSKCWASPPHLAKVGLRQLRYLIKIIYSWTCSHFEMPSTINKIRNWSMLLMLRFGYFNVGYIVFLHIVVSFLQLVHRLSRKKNLWVPLLYHPNKPRNAF
jgi:hypothetical protein